MLNNCVMSMMWAVVVFTCVVFILSAEALVESISDEAVKITSLQVPNYIFEGEDAELSCSFEATDRIYSIKWYRDDKEFFHFIPSQKPSKMLQPVPGVRVDINLSSGHVVILRSVSLESEGRYKCEVSSEWPQYFTSDKSSQMDVIVMPESKVKIYPTQNSYHFGKSATFVCTSPAHNNRTAILNWYINNKNAPQNLVHNRVIAKGVRGVEQHRASLTFIFKKRNFKNGRANIKCTSYLPPTRSKRGSFSHDQVVFKIPHFSIGGKREHHNWRESPKILELSDSSFGRDYRRRQFNGIQWQDPSS